MTLDFRAAARMDDLLDVLSVIEGVGGASVAMRQMVVRDTQVLVEAGVRLGLVAGGRAIRLPASLAEKLAAAGVETRSS